jgi:hypothetical protein
MLIQLGRHFRIFYRPFEFLCTGKEQR